MTNDYYNNEASSPSPALVIYLLDISGSMSWSLDGKSEPPPPQRRIDIVKQALDTSIQRLVNLSSDGSGRIKDRYQIAIYAYSEKVYDVLGGGIMPLSKVALVENWDDLRPMTATNTALAFSKVEALLREQKSLLEKGKAIISYDSPAPLVCHITDGEYNGQDPEKIVARIMDMEFSDGKVLVENIFISDQVLSTPIVSTRTWEGITASTFLRSEYAKKLRTISSPLPASYRKNMRKREYMGIREDAVMMLPGNQLDLIEMGLVMSTATKTKMM